MWKLCRSGTARVQRGSIIGGFIEARWLEVGCYLFSPMFLYCQVQLLEGVYDGLLTAGSHGLLFDWVLRSYHTSR